MSRMLHFQIDPHSGVPVYRQIIDQVKYYVAGGTLQSGEQLPSIRELSEQLTVNPTTVVKAYNELVHEEVIELRHGKGAFVAPQASGLTDQEKEKALRRIARQLAIEATQMGAAPQQVLAIVEQEFDSLRTERVEPQMPVKLSVVPRK